MKDYQLLVGPERKIIDETDDDLGISKFTSSINDSILIEEVEPAKQGTFLNHGPKD